MTELQNPGCVVFLIDESAAMESPLQEAGGPMSSAATGQLPKSKATSLATALNALFKRLGDGPDFDIALIGYQTDSAEQAVVESRWGGALAGREFVSIKELSGNPVTVETRTRKLPNPAGFGPLIEEPVSFPVWYVPQSKGKAPQVAAFRRCHEMLTNWLASAGPNPGAPLVFHLFAGGSGDGNPQKVIEDVMQFAVPSGSPLLLQAHFSTSKNVPATLYPSNRYYLPAGPQKDLFPRCSELPESLVTVLKQAKVAINPNAVGMLYNAKMVDIAMSLKLVESLVKSWPARTLAAPIAPPEPAPVVVEAVAAPEVILEPVAVADVVIVESEPAEIVAVAEPVVEAVVRERAALLVCVLDRSLADPFSGDTKNACARLQEHLNDLLGKLAKRPTEVIETSVISYGIDSMGEVEVRTTLEGSLSGQAIVRDSELSGGALRVEEFEQQVPNGVGGLMTIPVKKSIFVELEPTAAASPVSAFAVAQQVLTDWCGRHPTSLVPPIVLHLSRGQIDSAALQEAAGLLQLIPGSLDPVSLFHLVVTETPHRSVVYPEQASELETPELQQMFELSSPVLNREQVSASNPNLVKPEARGFVVNGKIDLLVETLRDMLKL